MEPLPASKESVAWRDGFQRGVQLGLLEGTRDAVLVVLSNRFGRVPDAVRAEIARMQWIAEVTSLHRRALQVESMAEFELALCEY